MTLRSRVDELKALLDEGSKLHFTDAGYGKLVSEIPRFYELAQIIIQQQQLLDRAMQGLEEAMPMIKSFKDMPLTHDKAIRVEQTLADIRKQLGDKNG